MRLHLLLALAAICTLATVIPSGAQAITNGQYDGYDHPYVAFVANGDYIYCTGVLLSPTVMLTAAHCFFDTSMYFNTETGAPLVRVDFDPNLTNTPREQAVYHVGSYYFDPQFKLNRGADTGTGKNQGGLPATDTHDIAVIIFNNDGCYVPFVPPNYLSSYSCGPVPPAETLGKYATLPSLGMVDTLAMNTDVDLVGYGVQYFINGGGPCIGPCKKREVYGGTRYFASSSLIQSNSTMSDEFIKLHANKGGLCNGDSGGPDLIGGTDIVIGINSLGGDQCTSDSYSYRVDTAQALDWIRSTLASHGGSL